MPSARAPGLLLIQSCILVVACSGSNETSTGPSNNAAGGSPSATGGSKNSGTGGASGSNSAQGGRSSSGGVGSVATGGKASGGTTVSTSPLSTGGARASGGTRNAGGSPGDSGGTQSTGGRSSAGGTSSSVGGGSKAVGGSTGSGGSSSLAGGGKPTGGTRALGGTSSAGGASNATGGSKPTGGSASAGGSSSSDDCIKVSKNELSAKIATVGVVEWSTTLGKLSSAQVVYTLDAAASNILNKGGTAPVDLTKTNYRTLLLGLKPSSSYTFHIEATAEDGTTCKSADQKLPKTGTLTGVPSITRTATNATAQAKGFISTCGGLMGNTPAIIIDADGTVVWAASAPGQCSRVRMDYEGANMWMMALNVSNGNGEMRYISMDGVTSQNNVSGLSKAHHDFTVLPGGIVATMVWSTNGTDVESDLIEHSPSGTNKTAFHIGKNLYAGGQSELGAGSNSYHCNSILYHEADDSYTIGDRNPNMFVKVSRAGSPQWQFGGNCSGAPAPKCATATWDVNHGHQLLDDGHFLLFANGAFGSRDASRAYEFNLSTSGTMSATLVKNYASSGNEHSDSLGDVQRLPNGNTLVVFSNNGLIQELDSSWAVVQTLKANSFAFADWRETLYGPPAR